MQRDNINDEKKEYPQLPAYETYEELMAAIKEVI